MEKRYIQINGFKRLYGTLDVRNKGFSDRRGFKNSYRLLGKMINISSSILSSISCIGMRIIKIL